LSGQLESPHFYRRGDLVRFHDGGEGVVAESFALYALIRLPTGEEREYDQFDPRIVVLQRSERESG
jgi:hypothetical protein